MRGLLVKLKRGSVTQEDAPTTARGSISLLLLLPFSFWAKIYASGTDLHRKYFLLPLLLPSFAPLPWCAITNVRGRRRNSNNSRVYPFQDV